MAATANARMEYDETGQRVWMTDGEGRVDYVYDTLSRLKEETRQFGGVNRSHTLEYEYNLVGAVKSVTDPFGAKVNYTLDSAGRLESVTGENFAGGGSYAAGMKYRAWGALKDIGYGNGLMASATYNARGQVASFAVTGRNAPVGTPTVMSAEYEYDADGSIRYMKDLVDTRFSRAFTYDHVGRLREAMSGGAAENFYTGTTTSYVESPYYQSIAHDEWGKMTSSSSMFWSMSDTINAAYNQTTGTNAAWEYDAAGNLTRDANRFYKWDAAGRNARAVSTRNASDTLVQGYSGDGARVRKTETVPATITSYYVTSSVLGGRVVTELNAQGEKKTTYVYGAGEVIAKQEVVSGTSSVRWVHQDPVVGSRQETSPTGATLTRTEVNADGIDVGVSDPQENIELYEPQPTDVPRFMPFGGSFPDGRCTLDGMAIGCGWATQMLESGVAVRAPEQTVRAVYNSATGRYQGFEFFRAYADGFSGFLPQGATYNGGGSYTQTTRAGFLIDGVEVSSTTVTRTGYIDRTPAFINAGFGFGGRERGGPREPTTVDPVPNAEPTTDERSDCGKVVDDLVSRTNYLLNFNTKFTSADAGRPMGYLAKNGLSRGSKDIPHDGFRWELVNNGQRGDVLKHVYGHAGAILIGNAKLYGWGGGRTGNQIHEDELGMDRGQLNDPAHRLEAETEIRGSLAGRDVGNLMRSRIQGDISKEALRSKIFNILCEY